LINKNPAVYAHLENKSVLFSFRIGNDGRIAPDGKTCTWIWTIYAFADARARRDIENDLTIPEAVKQNFLTAEEYYSVDFDGEWLFGSIPDLVHQTYSATETLGHLRFAFSRNRLINRSAPSFTVFRECARWT
jgi:zinc transporter